MNYFVNFLPFDEDIWALFVAPKADTIKAESKKNMAESSAPSTNQNTVLQPLKVKKIVLKRPTLVTSLSSSTNEKPQVIT